MYKKTITIVIIIFVLIGVLISCDDFFSPVVEVFIENNNKDYDESKTQNQHESNKNKNIIKKSRSAEELEF